MTSCEARPMSSPVASGSRPKFELVRAAASLRIPRARMISLGMRSSPIRKLAKERAVWLPQ